MENMKSGMSHEALIVLLSPMQRRIVWGLIEGRTIPELHAATHLTPSRLSRQIELACLACNCSSRYQLVALCARAGYVERESWDTLLTSKFAQNPISRPRKGLRPATLLCGRSSGNSPTGAKSPASAVK